MWLKKYACYIQYFSFSGCFKFGFNFYSAFTSEVFDTTKLPLVQLSKDRTFFETKSSDAVLILLVVA